MKNEIVKKKTTAAQKAAFKLNKWTISYTKMSPLQQRVSPPTKAGLRHDNGLTFSQLGHYKKESEAFRIALEKAHTMIAAYYERSLLRGGNHLTGVIFLLKTTFHYRENEKGDTQPVSINISLDNKGNNHFGD